MDKKDELRLGFETAYIDGNVASNVVYRPQFYQTIIKKERKFYHL